MERDSFFFLESITTGRLLVLHLHLTKQLVTVMAAFYFQYSKELQCDKNRGSD